MIPERYRLENLLKILRHPRALLGELSKVAIRANIIYHQNKKNEGVDVIDRDWDNLIIIDGCRFDTFQEVSGIQGNLEACRSSGSESWEFMQNNFVGEELHDTVLITANPHTTKIPPKTFHSIKNLVKTCWDSELRTVPPDAVTKAALETIDEYPNKRLIVHYMQPHYPFIGKTGQQIAHGGFNPDDNVDRGGHVWTKLQYGFLDESEVREAYRENLEIVLEEVEHLLSILNGKSVLTSDHGNLIGERIRPIPVKTYGHPRGLQVPELFRVPWLVRESDTRRKIQSDPPTERDQIEDEVVNNRLQALGYK
jgi:hypothetical protein